MTIAATRFKVLDKQLDVGVSNFSSITGDDILNIPDNTVEAFTPEFKAFLENSVQVPEVKPASVVDVTVRAAKDAMGAIRDVSKYSSKDIDKLVGGLMGGNQTAQSMFNKLGPKCSTKGLSTGSLGKPYDAKIDCNGKSRKGTKAGCTSSGYSDILNKLTGGAYQSSALDLNAALQNLVSLSKYGYDVNLCGVFSTLSAGLNKNLLSRASGALLGKLSLSGNTLGVFDLAGASAGLHSLIENPGGITSAFSNLKMPTEVLGKDISGLSDRLTGSMSLFKDDWNKSPHDQILSTGMCGKYNTAVDKILSAKQTGNSFSALNLNMPMEDDDTYIATAYSMKNASASNETYGSMEIDGLYA